MSRRTVGGRLGPGSHTQRVVPPVLPSEPSQSVECPLWSFSRQSVEVFVSVVGVASQSI